MSSPVENEHSTEAEIESNNIDSEMIIRKSFQSCRLKVVELMRPDVVLDQFLVSNVFGEMTQIEVKEMKERSVKGTTIEVNRTIHDKVLVDPEKYMCLKNCIARSGQTSLLKILTQSEISVHNKLKDEGYTCPCESPETCSVLNSLECCDASHFIPHTIKELQHSLIVFYEKMCQTIPVYALVPEVTEHVTNLYVTPNMLEVDIRGTNSCRKTNMVCSYRDIFYKDGKPCRNVYITGEAGIGKSALCESMVSTWCRAHARLQSGDESILLEDEKVIAEYPLLFYISLRYAMEDNNIEQMICKQLSVDNVTQLLENEKCLVLLDGLDEWVSHERTKGSKYTSKGLPHRSIKGCFTILTTSRPWKLEILRLKENEIDKQINITGLNDVSAKVLAKRVLSVLNTSHDTNKQESEFLRFMSHSRLDTYMKTPVLLSQMACLWYYDVPFGDSECEMYCNIIDKQIELADQQKDLPNDRSQNTRSSGKYHTHIKCFKNKANCQMYSRTLLTLSEVAFNTLFHENRESSLVFNHRDTELYGMSTTDVEMCLRIGLLTQSTVFVNYIQKSKKISFIHKTHHEFFAALYIATVDQETVQSRILSNSRLSLDAFLEISKVLLFVNGINDVTGNILLKHMLELAAEDERVKAYRLSCKGPFDKNYPLVHRIQTIIIDCEHERWRCGLPASCLHLDDVVAVNNKDVNNLMTYWQTLRPKSVKSMSLQTTTSYRRNPNLTERLITIFDCVLSSRHLKKIYVWDTARLLTAEQIHSAVVNNRSTLTCLVLCHIDVTSLGSRLMDILSLPNLLTLGLGDVVYLTHMQLTLVSEFLERHSGVQELRLKRFLCKADTNQSTDYKIEFEMPNNTALRRLFVAGRIDKIQIDSSNLVLLEARSVTVPGIIKELLMCLKGSTKLTELLLQCDFEEDIHAMVEVLPQLSSVRQVRLNGMELTGVHLRFPPSMRMLEFVEFYNLVMGNACLKSMIEDLPEQRVEIWMGEINILKDDDTEFVKDFIRRSNDFEVTLDDPVWMYFHTK